MGEGLQPVRPVLEGRWPARRQGAAAVLRRSDRGVLPRTAALLNHVNSQLPTPNSQLPTSNSQQPLSATRHDWELGIGIWKLTPSCYNSVPAVASFTAPLACPHAYAPEGARCPSSNVRAPVFLLRLSRRSVPTASRPIPNSRPRSRRRTLSLVRGFRPASACATTLTTSIS